MRKWHGITAVLVILATVLGMVASACAGGGEKAAPPVSTGPVIYKMGCPTPLSGPAAPWGQAGHDFYQKWIELFNQAGGFKVGDTTYNVTYTEVDDENTPEGGAAAAKQLIFGDGCQAIVAYWSWGMPAVQAVTTPAKVLLLTRTGNEAVPMSEGGIYDPAKYPYTVFANPSHEQIISDFKAIAKAYPGRIIGIEDSTLGKGAGWDVVDKTLDAAGIKYHHEWYTPAATDYTPYITKFKEAGCGVIYNAGDIGAAFDTAKQRWDMGYKDIICGVAGPCVDPAVYNEVVGYDASQGFIDQYFGIWDYKETKIDPAIMAMAKQVNDDVAKDTGAPVVYTGWIGWMPSHMLILTQAMTKAGSTDPDAIMKAIQGGTFSTTTGTYTMSGAKTYGSPIVFGTPGALSQIKGDKEVYLSESPWTPLP